MPCRQLGIWPERERLPGQMPGEPLPIACIDQIESSQGFLEKMDVLIRIEKQLEGLPSDETLQRERRYRGRLVWVDIRLQRVIAADRAIDEGDGGMGCPQEEILIVTSGQAVETVEFLRCQAEACHGLDTVDLDMDQPE